MALTLLPDVIHTGTVSLANTAVTIEHGRIVALGQPTGEALRMSGLHLAPGLVDVQVNGGDGLHVNDQPTPEGVARIVTAHLRRGTTSMLPTYITGPVEGMLAAVEAVRVARAELGDDVVLGLHFEGPAIGPERAGVHPARWIRDTFPHEVLHAARNHANPVPLLITVAPECVSPGTIADLVAWGVRVSVGHSNASAEHCAAAIDEGASLITHLFNATRPVTARDPGVVGEALTNPQVCCAVIPDGRHVHSALLRLVRAAKPEGQAFFTSDALAAAAGGPTTFTFADQRISVQRGACETDSGTLAGASVDLAEAMRRGMGLMDMGVAEALRWASTFPGQWWLPGSDLGMLKPGAPATMIAVDDGGEVRGVMRRGEWVVTP